jgi:endonuclease YncB( thermonuclease family)
MRETRALRRGKFLNGLVFLAVVCAANVAARSEAIKPSQIFVVSGDTIEVFNRRPAVALVGFKAPERRPARAQCAAERALGSKATQRVRELVSGGGLDYEARGCACEPGTQGTSRCNLGRTCGILTVKGRDLGQILIEEKLAVSFVCSETSCPPPPNPWCAAR